MNPLGANSARSFGPANFTSAVRPGAPEYPQSAYASPTPRGHHTLSTSEKAKMGVRYALKPKTLIKSSVFWGVATAMFGGLTFPFFPAFLALGVLRRVFQAIRNPEKIAKQLQKYDEKAAKKAAKKTGTLG